MCEALATMSSIVEKRRGEGEREGGKRDSCGMLSSIYIKKITRKLELILHPLKCFV